MLNLISHIHNHCTPKSLNIPLRAYLVLKSYTSYIDQRLARYGDTRTWVSVEKVAEDIGCHPKTVQRMLGILIKNGFMTRKRSNSNAWLSTVFVDKLGYKIKETNTKLKNSLNLVDILSSRKEINDQESSEILNLVDKMSCEYNLNNNNYINNNIINNPRVDSASFKKQPFSESEASFGDEEERILSRKAWVSSDSDLVSPSSSKTFQVNNNSLSNLDEGGDLTKKEIDQKLPDGRFLHKMEKTNMDELGYTHQKKATQQEIPQEIDGPSDILDALMESRSSFTKADPGDKNADLGIIGIRLDKLIKRSYTMSEAVSLCLEVVKYWHHRLEKVLTGEYKTRAVNTYCASKVFGNEAKFDEACKNLVNGVFYDPVLEAEKKAQHKRKLEEEAKKLVSLKEHQERKIREELKQADAVYQYLLIEEEQARVNWIKHCASKELLAAFNTAMNKRIEYERDFKLKRSNE